MDCLKCGQRLELREVHPMYESGGIHFRLECAALMFCCSTCLTAAVSTPGGPDGTVAAAPAPTAPATPTAPAAPVYCASCGAPVAASSSG